VKASVEMIDLNQVNELEKWVDLSQMLDLLPCH